MKEADLDWWIYHLLRDEPGLDPGVLSERTGLSLQEVRASLRRLEDVLLIGSDNKGYRVCSLQEMLLSCQARHDESAPFVIEDGIVKERKRPE